MPFISSSPWNSALAKLRSKGLLPTGMSSEELRGLSASIREQSIFSARTLMEGYLDKIKSALDDSFDVRQGKRPDRITPDNPDGYVTEGLNPTEVRQLMREKLDDLGYRPRPGERGTITDLSSDQRIRLVEETNRKLIESFAQLKQQESALDLFPAMELFRAEDRKVPREWEERWQIAGAATGRPEGDGWTGDGQMIALVGHEIWAELGSSENFDDALDTDRYPFAFNSGMETRAVSREDAVDAGIMTEDQQVIVERSEFEPFLGEEAA